jgi:hypothetical protein
MKMRNSDLLQRLKGTPYWTGTIFVAVYFSLFTLVALGIHGWDPLWFAWIGERYASLDPSGKVGYDGQFVTYIATLGSGAIPHLDNPAYRLQRILLPAIVRGVSIVTGLPVAWAVPLINLIAIVFTTHGLTRWLQERGLSPWYALAFVLSTGVFMAYSRNLTEPLAFCLAAWGVILWERSSYVLSALVLALAFMTKEIAIIFAIGLAFPAVVRRDIRAAQWPLLALIPLLLWETVLFLHFGQLPFRSGPSLELIPLSGIVPYLMPEPGRLSALLFVGLPALMLVPASFWMLYRQGGRYPAPWLTLLHSVFVVALPLDVYDHIMHAGRNASGMLLALVFLMPFLDKRARLLTLAYTVLPTLVWLVPVLRWAPWLSQV